MTLPTTPPPPPSRGSGSTTATVASQRVDRPRPVRRRPVPSPGPFDDGPSSRLADARRARRPGPARPARGAQPGAARGRHPRRRAAADRRRRRVGQDPGAHPPHRPPHPQRGRVAVRDPGHHVHQQGRRRDEAAGGRARRAGRPEDVGVDVPLGLRAHPAARRARRSASRRRSRSTTRPTRCASPATCCATSTSTPSGSRPGRCTPPSARPRTTASTSTAYAERAQVIFERKIADVYREYQARLQRAGAMDFDDLLGNAVRLFHEHPDVLEHYQQPLPPRARRRVPGHQPRPERARPPAGRRAPQRLRRRRQRPVPAARHAGRHARRARAHRARSRSATRCSAPPAARPQRAGTRHARSMPGHYSGPVVRVTRRRSRRCAARPTTSSRPAVARPPGTLVRLPDVAGRPRLPRRPDQERPHEQPRTAAGSASSSGCAQEHADKLWVLRVCADPSRGVLLGGVLRGAATASRRPASTASVARSRWTRRGSAQLYRRRSTPSRRGRSG